MQLDVRDLQAEPLPEETIHAAAIATAESVGLALDNLSLVFMDDEQIAQINRQFRDTNEATDVIAFEAERDGEGLSGEVIVSVETAARQAMEASHELKVELAWLIAHGVLHVAGMEDKTDKGRGAMLDQQREIMRRLGLRLHS